MRDQLLHVTVTSLPTGLTSLRSMHVQFHLDEADTHAHAHQQQQEEEGGAISGSSSSGSSGAAHHSHPLSAVFSDLQEFDFTHGDHPSADRLLEAALPHCTNLQQLHISGPGALTPLGGWGLGGDPGGGGARRLLRPALLCKCCLCL